MTQALPGLPPLPRQTSCRVVSEPARVSFRLSELHASLNESLLREANEHGYRARLEATALHPPTAAGSYHWHAVVYAIRSILTKHGWKSEDLRNCPFIVSPDRAVAMVVMTGDSDTGRPNGNPTNQAEKGPILNQAIARNQEQLRLFEAGPISSTLAGSKEATQLWVFLYHVGVGLDGKDEVRMEISLPSRFERKKIVEWSERIILGAIQPNDEVGVLGDASAEPMDVPVERRVGT